MPRGKVQLTHRVQLDMTPNGVTNLDALVERTRIGTRTATVRVAVHQMLLDLERRKRSGEPLMIRADAARDFV